MTDVSTETKFTIQSISTPRIDLAFNRTPTNDSYKQAFRVFCEILSDTSMRVVFGLYLASEEKTDENLPCTSIIVEVAVNVQMSVTIPTGLKKTIDVPWIGNILAIMYPFIRERIYSCMYHNGMTLFLPPLNTIEILKSSTGNPNFQLVDRRSSTEDKKAATF